MKILKESQTRKVRINQIIDKEGIVQHDKSRIMAVIQEYYEELYSSNQANPVDEHRTNIMNVGSEDVPEIYIQEIELALRQLKTGKAQGEDGMTVEMLKLRGDALLKAIGILLNKCLQSNRIQTYLIANIYLKVNSGRMQKSLFSTQKGDRNRIENYRPISILPHPYKLLTKILTNRLTSKIDGYQLEEQAGLRKGYSTIDHLQTC